MCTTLVQSINMHDALLTSLKKSLTNEKTDSNSRSNCSETWRGSHFRWLNTAERSLGCLRKKPFRFRQVVVDHTPLAPGPVHTPAEFLIHSTQAYSIVYTKTGIQYRASTPPGIIQNIIGYTNSWKLGIVLSRHPSVLEGWLVSGTADSLI